MGGKVPEKYRIENFMENVDMSNFVTVTIQRGSSLQLDFEVEQANSMIRFGLNLVGIATFYIVLGFITN